MYILKLRIIFATLGQLQAVIFNFVGHSPLFLGDFLSLF